MDILEGMWNTRIYYKGIPVNLFGVPMLLENKKNCSKKTFNDTIYRLKKKGFIEIRSEKWFLTELGKKYFENKRKLATKFNSSFPLNSPKNLLLMFDIPESRKSEREWLRWHLKEFQYSMLQQSVWIGPSPLPKKFLEHVKNIDINKFIKTFKLAKPYQIK